MKIVLKMRSFFAKEAKNLRTEYKKLLTKKRGVRQDNAPKNDPKTVKAKGFDHWLRNTKETYNKGILYRAFKSGFIVFASGKKHSGRRKYVKYKDGSPVQTVTRRAKKSTARYKDIFNWHNKDRYSGIFGELPLGSNLPKRVDKELAKQIQPQIAKGVKKTLSRFKGIKFA